MSSRKRSVPGKRALIFAVVVLCALALGAYLYWTRPEAFDPALQKAFSNAANAGSYEEQVQTQDSLSGRTLNVDGTYLLDAPADRYASFSTTTLVTVGSKKPVIFSLDNISIGSDLYTRVQTESNVPLAVPSSKTWQHFQADAIPSAYAGIAVAGPLLDNLKLFEGGGKYLTLTGEPVQEQQGGATLTHYTFKLSPAADLSSSGTLGVLMERIGEGGSIDVWIDTSDGTIRYMRFKNASYVSTTTISNVNATLSIEAPAVSQ